MYVSSNWLKIVLNLKKIKLNFLKEKLMLYGFEIEETNLLKIKWRQIKIKENMTKY